MVGRKQVNGGKKMAMNKTVAARIIARAQAGRLVDSAVLNTALAVHSVSRADFDAMRAELGRVKGNRRSAKLVLSGKFEELIA